jgi:hypothetical protein
MEQGTVEENDFTCPECKAVIEEKYRTLWEITCPSCGRAKFLSGLTTLPVYGIPGQSSPPRICAIHAAYWELIPPAPPTPKAMAPYSESQAGTGMTVQTPILPEMLSAADLAREIGMDPRRVESFLRRYRKRYPDCCEQIESPRKNEPKYLYRTKDVVPVLTAKLTNKRRTDAD